MSGPLYRTEFPSPVGTLTLLSDEKALLGLWLAGQKYFLGPYGDGLAAKRETPVLTQTIRWLERYFHGERPSPAELPLSPAGTAFQQRVWQYLLIIPYGETVTYGDIAGVLRSSPRAVGSAVGRNPISIIVPCHRVLGAGGSLTGYAGGVERKTALLKLEGVDISKLFKPKKGTALSGK